MKFVGISTELNDSIQADLSATNRFASFGFAPRQDPISGLIGGRDGNGIDRKRIDGSSAINRLFIDQSSSNRGLKYKSGHTAGKPAAAVNKRKIVCSDDEDDTSFPVASSSLINGTGNDRRPATKMVSKSNLSTPGSDDWIESRTELTKSQIERNQKIALEQRRQTSSKLARKLPSKPISKKKNIPIFADDDGNDGNGSTPGSLGSQAGYMFKPFFKSKLLTETFTQRDADLDAVLGSRTTEETFYDREERTLNRPVSVGLVRNSSVGSSSVGLVKNSSIGLVRLRDDDTNTSVRNSVEAKGLVHVTTCGSEANRAALTVVEDDDDNEDDLIVNRKRKPTIASKLPISAALGVGNTSKQSDNESDDTDDSRVIVDILDMKRSDIQRKANGILQHCRRLSNNLRKSLTQWETGSSSSSSSRSPAAIRDCIDLTKISQLETGASPALQSYGSTVSQILFDSDIQHKCPGLALKGYQLVGINWLKLLHENHVNGVLADDMGLGKTIQTIAFLGWLRHRSSNSEGKGGPKKPHLIVVPASTLSNWQNELERFCPSLEVTTYHGSQQDRAELRYELRRPNSCSDVILSTYTIFEKESCKPDRSFLCSLKFDYLILDEAHCIKNTNSSRFQYLNQLRTDHRLLLSGTPVQNNISELLSMLSFLMPQVFGRHDLELLIDALNIKGMMSNNQQRGDMSLLQLRSMLAPFVLRRLKRDVLDQLSSKTTIVRSLVMTEFQRRVYDCILLGHSLRKDELKGKPKQRAESSSGSADGKTDSNQSSDALSTLSIDRSVQQCITTIGSTSDTSAKMIDTSRAVKKEDEEEEVVAVVEKMSASEANNLFTALRKAANHPLLLRVHYKDAAVLDKIAKTAYNQEHFGNQCDLQRVRAEIELLSDFDLHCLCLEYPLSLKGLELDSTALYDSPKMELLQSMLPQLQREGHRMLVFSQWTKIMDLLEVLLQDIDMKYLRLDGSTPVKERQSLIDTFSNDASIPVFLLSTKAGGLGINLTAADTVILHDMDFNPENDKQAEDRCHRIGQSRAVTVYKLYAEGTVDEDIFHLGERKSQLSKAVLDDEQQMVADGESDSGGEEDVVSLKKKGSKRGKKRDEEEGRLIARPADDRNLISNILQKALLSRQRVHQPH